MKDVGNTPPINVKSLSRHRLSFFLSFFLSSFLFARVLHVLVMITLSSDKDKWIDRERLHWASLFNIPMSSTTPIGFPHMTLRVQRALCVLPFLFPEENRAQDVLCHCLDRFYELYWVEGKNITAPGFLEDVLKHVVGEEKMELVVKEIAGKGKEAVMGNNERAVREGAFGLPVSFLLVSFFLGGGGS